MLGQLKKNISLNLQAALGKRLNRKIVVFESDDWGGIRMPSQKVYHQLCEKGLPIQNDFFNKFDSNASATDAAALFDVLAKHKDHKGNHPVFTFNVTTGVPNFGQIKQSHFNDFSCQPFDEVMEQTRPGALKVWKEGIAGKLMLPQYHGREHVHQQRWLESLRNGNEQVHFAFEHGVFGIVTGNYAAEHFMAAYDYPNGAEEDYQQQSIAEGLSTFERVFGFTPKTFIPPCYIASPNLLAYLRQKGVPGLQGKIIHLAPKGIINGKRTYQKTLRQAGLDKKTGQVNLVRNAFFEPSAKPGFDWVANCLKRMEVAFKWGKPVIIDTHRVNYVGEIVENNRTANLLLLNELLQKMRTKWSDIEFMHSAQLANIYTKENG